MVQFFGERLIIGGFILILFFVLILKIYSKQFLTKDNLIIMKFLSDLGLFFGGIAVFYTYLKDSLQRTDTSADAAIVQDQNYTDILQYVGENKSKIPIVYKWVVDSMENTNKFNNNNNKSVEYLNDNERLALEYVNSKFFQSWLVLIKLVDNDEDMLDGISNYKQLDTFWKNKERHPLAERFAKFYAVEDVYHYLQQNEMYFPKPFIIYVDASIIKFQKNNMPKSLKKKYNLH